MTPLVAVLAGGRARRLGGDKACALLAGRPLISWPLGAARDAGLEAVVVARSVTRLPPLEAEVWREPDGPAHPLAGIVWALERAGRDVIAVGCDMPFVTPEALLTLASTPAPAGTEPLLARYGLQALATLRVHLAEQGPLRSAFAALSPAAVEIDPGCLRNVNDPAELEAAARDLGA